MSGKQKIDFEKISAELAAKEGPILLRDLPDIRLDLRGVIRYAKEREITVPEMSDEEKQMFVETAMPSGNYVFLRSGC